jgi:hypothetical protein
MELPDGTVFGLLDNGLVVLGAYAGVDIEARIARAFGRDPNATLGAVLGGATLNLISDSVGCVFDPAMNGMLLGVALGCAIPLLWIPVFERVRTQLITRSRKD